MLRRTFPLCKWLFQLVSLASGFHVAFVIAWMHRQTLSLQLNAFVFARRIQLGLLVGKKKKKRPIVKRDKFPLAFVHQSVVLMDQ